LWQGLLLEQLDAAGTSVTPCQMFATSLPPLLPQVTRPYKRIMLTMLHAFHTLNLVHFADFLTRTIVSERGDGDCHQQRRHASRC